MPKASKATAARSASAHGYEGRFEELGDYTVAFEEFTAGGDMAPPFRGLPDDRCQSSHWRAARPHPVRRPGNRDDRVHRKRSAPGDDGGRDE